MTVILTAITDGFDTLKDLPEQDVDVEAICVTDNPDLTSGTWKVVYEPRSDVHPCRAAKRPKMCPWLYSDATSSVWVDASMRITSHRFVSDLLDLAEPVAQFKHPDRNCLYDEGRYSLTLGKYANEPLIEQMLRYREEGHPDHWGLWCAGVIARHHTPQVVAMNEAWLHECEHWSFQDQVSEPALLRRHRLRPRTLPGVYWKGQNPWLGFEGSARH